MATTRQKRVAKLIIQNTQAENPITDIEILKRSNYSTTTAETKSTYVIKSDGVKEALNDYGFNEDNAKIVVSQILLRADARDNDRLKAADMVFDVHGSKAPTKSENVNLNITTQIAPEDQTRLLALLNDKRSTG